MKPQMHDPKVNGPWELAVERKQVPFTPVNTKISHSLTKYIVYLGVIKWITNNVGKKIQ